MKFKNYIIYSVILYFSYTGNAYAYLDPGTGSIIISTIIAFFVALWGYIKIYYTKIKNFLMVLIFGYLRIQQVDYEKSKGLDN